MGRSVGELNYENLLISPKYRVSDWVEARNANNWTLMVDVFKDRIEGRYLSPIRLIAKSHIGEFSGFSILALDCLIVETLNQFYLGANETEGNHAQAFWVFFQQSEYFRAHFTNDIATIFYRHFRCGLLHQAQTKCKSVIRIDQDVMIKPVNGDLNDGLVVDRVLFHEALENEIYSYQNKLIDGENIDLRDNFKTKMGFICGAL